MGYKPDVNVVVHIHQENTFACKFTRTARGTKLAINLCNRCELTHKWCSKCDTILSKLEFYPAKGKRSGRVAHCKTCYKNAYSACDRKQRTVAQYGLTAAEWQQMHDAQCGLCAICEQPPNGGQWDVLYTDHDHQTGQLRKLLCSNCNKGLGCFGDNTDVLMRAAEYLLMFKGVKEVS